MNQTKEPNRYENNDALTTIAAELKRLNRLVAYVIRRHLDHDYREEIDKIMEEE